MCKQAVERRGYYTNITDILTSKHDYLMTRYNAEKVRFFDMWIRK